MEPKRPSYLRLVRREEIEETAPSADDVKKFALALDGADLRAGLQPGELSPALVAEVLDALRMASKVASGRFEPTETLGSAVGKAVKWVTRPGDKLLVPWGESFKVAQVEEVSAERVKVLVHLIDGKTKPIVRKKSFAWKDVRVPWRHAEQLYP